MVTIGEIYHCHPHLRIILRLTFFIIFGVFDSILIELLLKRTTTVKCAIPLNVTVSFRFIVPDCLLLSFFTMLKVHLF